MERKVQPLSEDLTGLGFTDRTPGGAQAFAGMIDLIPGAFEPTGAAGAPAAPAAPMTEDAAPGADAADPIDGPVVSEQTLECVGAILAHAPLTEDTEIDLEAMDPEKLEQMGEAIEQRLRDLQQVVDEMADKEVPAELEERTSEIMGRVITEIKMLRILGGKVTRVLKRIGSAAIKAHRKAKMYYKKKKAHVKQLRKKAGRKAKTKIMAAKTARKRLSMGLKSIAKKAGGAIKGALSKVRKAKGGGGLVAHESDLAARLSALLDEGHREDRSEAQRERDDLVECIGNVLTLIEWITQDDEAVGLMAEEYERIADEFCAGALNEAKTDEAAFIGRVTPIVRAIGACVEELEKNLGRSA
jgi:hypothetical protein